jgi:hypothetical protein
MGASLSSALRALVGAEISQCTSDVEWYGSHIGFNDQLFLDTLKRNGSDYLPFPPLARLLNNEVYYTCRI